MLAVIERMTPKELGELDMLRLEQFLAQIMDQVAEIGPDYANATEALHMAKAKHGSLDSQMKYLALMKGSAQTLLKTARESAALKT